MPTIEELARSGELVAIEVDLEPDQLPERRLFGTRRLIAWLGGELPTMSTRVHSPRTPLEQVDDLLSRFVAGGALQYSRMFHELDPADLGVWELKTDDVRIFGWFPERGCFVAVAAYDATDVHERRMYAGFRGEVVRARLALMKTEEKFLAGRSDRDVL